MREEADSSRLPFIYYLSIFHAVILTRARVHGYFVIGDVFIFSNITLCVGDFVRLLRSLLNKDILLSAHKCYATRTFHVRHMQNVAATGSFV